MANYNVISHRGANREAPQNTLAAFRRSFEIGCTGVETDIHLTKDGVPVICHNFTIDETSTGTGAIKDMTLEELRQYDFGSYKGEEFKGELIPTLDEFLDLCKEQESLKVLNIEIKSEVYGELGLELPQKAIEAVKAHGLFDKLIISSFDPAVLVVCKKLDPECKTAILYAPDKLVGAKIALHPVSFAKSIKADAIHPVGLILTKSTVVRAQKAGIMVNPWTITKEKDIKRMIALGVDGLITDDPGACNRLIEEANK